MGEIQKVDYRSKLIGSVDVKPSSTVVALGLGYHSFVSDTKDFSIILQSQHARLWFQQSSPSGDMPDHSVTVE